MLKTLYLLGLLLLQTLPMLARADEGSGLTRLGPREGVIATAINSDPDNIPTMGLWLWSRDVLFIYATFPNIEDTRVDCAVFESGHAYLEQFSSIDLPADDTIQVRHRYLKNPEITHVLTIKAATGEVTCTGSLELDPEADASNLPDTLWEPDICFQLRYSPAFQAYSSEVSRNSVQHAVQYRKYLERCFIFMEDGLTYLDDTVRNEFASSVGWKQDDPRNNPPITQRHLGVWQGAPPDWMKYVSPDRYVSPILGTVSRDGAHLVALAGISPNYMQQALFECLHSYSRWLPEDAPLIERTWIRKIYAMENDTDALLERFYKDFPHAEKQE